MNTIVVNLFGEPGSGKSTAAMDITARLKRKGVNAEYVSEFAKDKLYENNKEIFKHQEYIFGKQSYKMGRVKDKVQVIVVDSPLILSVIYNKNDSLGSDFYNTVLNVHNSYSNKNYLLKREHAYEDEGRFQNEEESLGVRKQIINALDAMNIAYDFATSSELDCEIIANKIAEEIEENEQQGTFIY